METKQETCKDKVGNAMESRLDDLRLLYTPYDAEDNDLKQAAEDFGISTENMEPDDIRDALLESQNEYGLSFDYVAPNTFTDQKQGYFRYQISYGGPSEEFRFYCNPDLSCYKIEFWYLDWFDGASRVLCDTDEKLLMNIFEQFQECGMLKAEIEKSIE